MKKWIWSGLSLLAVLVLFQNCSNKTFSTKSSASTLSVDSNSGETDLGEATGGSPNGSSSGGNSNSSSNTGNSTPGTPKNLDNEIVTAPPPQPVNFSGCQSYQEITGDMIVVPARTSAGICYYVRLMSEQSAGSSGTRGEALATDVVARPHSPRPDEGNHPYILGQKEITQLQLLGARNVALSGSFTDPQASMFIDNFFLLEQSTEVGSYRAWAYGTADAEPGGGKISVNNFVVENFYSYASGGTARVTAIDMTAAIPAGLRMSIRFRGLDCGASARASDVFMVFH